MITAEDQSDINKYIFKCINVIFLIPTVLCVNTAVKRCDNEYNQNHKTDQLLKVSTFPFHFTPGRNERM